MSEIAQHEHEIKKLEVALTLTEHPAWSEYIQTFKDLRLHYLEKLADPKLSNEELRFIQGKLEQSESVMNYGNTIQTFIEYHRNAIDELKDEALSDEE
jgi:hypothetical protein